jgi:tetratricopeptide (TPR) repeat protein
VRALLAWLVLTVAVTHLAAAADVGEAKAHYEKATSAYALGRFAEAAEEYEKAFALKLDGALLYNAAQAHRLAGNKPRALMLYQNYMRVFADASNRDEVKRYILDLQRQIEEEAKNPPKPEAPRSAPPVAVAPPATPPPVATPAPTNSAPPTTATPALVATPSRAADKPVTKRAWFWATMAGAVVVVAAGVTLGVVLGSPDKNPAANLGKVDAN